MGRGRGRLWRRFEKIVLGALMGTAAYLIERRLQRAVRRMREDEGRGGARQVTFGPEEP